MGSVSGSGGRRGEQGPARGPRPPGLPAPGSGRWRPSPSLLLVLLVLLAQAAVGKPLGQGNVEQSVNGCDRTIWSSPGEPRGVHQVSVGCSEGAISWQQADGALRVVFAAPAPLPPGRQLETCLSVSSHLLKVVISLESSGTEAMQPLAMLTREFPRTAKDLCIRSDQPVKVFLETQPGEPNMALGYVKIQYDVASVVKNDADSMEECRPCTEEELLLSVCSMDFAVSGRMNSVQHSSILQQTTIDISVGKVYRQKSEHFMYSSDHSRLRRDVTKTSSQHSAATTDADAHRGTIVAPHKCGIRHGHGDFLFVGRMRLGRALLQCAPRMEEFTDLWTAAVKQGQNPCNLD